MTVTPWGSPVLAEDGSDASYVLSAFPGGPTYAIVRDQLNDSEFCGPTFAGDGKVLGSTSLLFAVIAAAAGGKAWSAAVGMNDLGFVAAADFGIALERFAVVPEPGPQWLGVVAALVDGVGIVAVRPPSPVALANRQRLAARVRHHEGMPLMKGQVVRS